MNENIDALYRAIARTEHHIATMQTLLRVLRVGHSNARRDAQLRAYLRREIDYYVGELAALHAERAALQRAVNQLRKRKGGMPMKW